MDGAMRDAARDAGGTVEVEWTREYEAFSMPEDSPVIGVLKAACADVGLEPRLFTTGGGSDGSILAATGTPTLVLSCGMTGVHSTDERVSIADLEALAQLVAATIVRLGEQRA